MDNHDDEQLEKMFAAQKTSFAEAVVYSQNLAVIAASRHACQKSTCLPVARRQSSERA